MVNELRLRDNRQREISTAQLRLSVVTELTHLFFYPFICLSGVGAATPTPVSTKCRNTAEAFPHQHTQTETPLWEGEGATGGQPSGCITHPVKEEPSDLETVIKWEVCEGALLDQQDQDQDQDQCEAEYQDKETHANNGKLNCC